MSRALRVHAAGVMLVGVLSLLLPAWGLAQAPRDDPNEYMDRVRKLNEIAAQKTENDVRDALTEARRLAPRDPLQAAARLRSTLRILDGDTSLSPSRRDQLARTLSERIRLYEQLAQRPAPPLGDRPISPPRRPAGSYSPSDGGDVAGALESIRVLQRAGDLEEARRQAAALAARYPDNPTVQATRRNLDTAWNLGELHGQTRDSERRIASLNRDLQTSSTPPGGDMEYPRDWAEKSKRRSSNTQLTAKERAIVRGLRSPITIDFKGKFEEAIDQVSKAINQPIVLDRVALEEAQITYDTPVTVHANGLAARTVLRQILGRFGLAYVIRDEALEVTSETRAREMMIVRSYYIGDLLGNSGIAGLAALGDQFNINPLLIAKQAAQLIDMIQSSVEPSSWQKNGGAGTIVFNPATSSLVIKQSAEVHAMLGGG